VPPDTPPVSDALDQAVDVRRGQTPAEVGRFLRVNGDRVRDWIRRGEMGALNLAPRRCGRPRYIILPEHLAEFVRRHRAATPAAKSAPRRRRPAVGQVDYFPD
jgi:hypothetical protein